MRPPDDYLSGSGLRRRWHAVLGFMAGALLGGGIAVSAVNGMALVAAAAMAGGMAGGWAGCRHGDRAWEAVTKWLPWIP